MEAAITVHLKDHGQDFLEFDIKGGKIIAARPFQHDIWSGREVLSETIAVGDYIVLRDDFGQRTLLYPVVEVHPMVVPIQVGPTDI